MLSPRETQVLDLASKGLSDKQIGHELGLSVHTLRTYWARIRLKTGTGPPYAAVSPYASQSNLVLGAQIHLDMASSSVEIADEHRASFGISETSILTLESFLDTIHPSDKEAFVTVLQEVANGVLPLAHFVYRRVVEGNETTLSIMLHMSASSDKVHGTVSEYHDVRELGY